MAAYYEQFVKTANKSEIAVYVPHNQYRKFLDGIARRRAEDDVELVVRDGRALVKRRPAGGMAFSDFEANWL